MIIEYHEKGDLLYIRLDPTDQQVTNHRVDDEVVLDLGADEKIVGVEVLNASRRVNLSQLLPVTYRRTA